MKTKAWMAGLAGLTLSACNPRSANQNPLEGTWRLLSATTITKGVSTVTDYTSSPQMIKIINATHFAFLKHDTPVARDSANHFDGGGGRYTLSGNRYTEQLDYYADKNWEHKTFDFTITINHDTLTQKGIEQVEKENINRVIIEKYVRIK